MRVFIDSSILIEFENGRQPELFDALLASNHELFINGIVASEYLYRLLGILGENLLCLSPKAAKFAKLLISTKRPNYFPVSTFLTFQNLLLFTQLT